MGKRIRSFDYLFIIRPVLFYPIWTVFLAGFIAAKKPENSSLITYWPALQSEMTNAFFWISFIGLSFLMAGVFIINQFTDINTDRENHKLFLIANKIVSLKLAIVETIVFLLIAFCISFLTSIRLGILLLLLFLFTGIAYSLPPLLGKNKPFTGLLINLLGGLFTFLIGWQVSSKLTDLALIKALPYVLAIGAVYFLTTIPDIEGDRLSGKITFAVRYGIKTTIIASILFEIACIGVSFWQNDWVILFPAMVSLGFFLRLIWTNHKKSISQAVHFPILFLSIAVGFMIPAYFLLIGGVYLLSKWYYANRFQLQYPSLS